MMSPPTINLLRQTKSHPAPDLLNRIQGLIDASFKMHKKEPETTINQPVEELKVEEAKLPQVEELKASEIVEMIMEQDIQA